MILLTILALILVMLTIVAVFVLSVGGTIGIIIFGDLLVCIIVIVWIMRRIIKRKR